MTRSRLSELIATGSTDHLDARDRALLERRARLRSVGDKPFPLDTRGWW